MEEQAYKNFLCGIAGVLPVAHQTVADLPDLLLITLEQQMECSAVRTLLPGFRGQLFVGKFRGVQQGVQGKPPAAGKSDKQFTR